MVSNGFSQFFISLSGICFHLVFRRTWISRLRLLIFLIYFFHSFYSLSHFFILFHYVFSTLTTARINIITSLVFWIVKMTYIRLFFFTNFLFLVDGTRVKARTSKRESSLCWQSSGNVSSLFNFDKRLSFSKNQRQKKPEPSQDSWALELVCHVKAVMWSNKYKVKTIFRECGEIARLFLPFDGNYHFQ